MARRSTIDKLPAELRELIGKLRQNGRTIDEILAKLNELSADVSRSALGRHVKQLDAIGEEIRRTRAIADAIVQRFGDAPESRTARLNIELMHGLVMKLMIGEGDDGKPVTLEPQDAYFLGTALQRLSQASKIDVDREVKIRERVKAEMAEKAAAAVDQAADKVAKAGGRKLDPETLRAIRQEIYGIV